jgi:hypothetical protein
MIEYKVFKNESGRMLAKILKSGIETTKYFPDALSWRVNSNDRMSNLRAFIKTHADTLTAQGFKLEIIKIDPMKED